jgi:diacylglycerol kinase (ATP)
MSKGLKKIIQSFKIAFKGILKVYATQLNFRIQFWWGVIVISQTFYWPVGEIKQLILLMLVVLMMVSEIINTTFESLFDFVEKRYNQKIGHLKDILAGATLLMAIGSAIIGTLILWPYILHVILYALIESIIIIILIYSFRGLRELMKSKKRD